MANPFPWYPWYGHDYAADTAHLSDPQDLYLRRLLDHYYKTRRPLPDDPGAWCNVCRAHSDPAKGVVRSVVNEFFHLESDGWHNRRADLEIAKMDDVSEKRSKAGKASAERRRTVSPPSTPVEHVLTQSQPQPQSQPEAKSKPEEKEREERANARSAHSLSDQMQKPESAGDDENRPPDPSAAWLAVRAQFRKTIGQEEWDSWGVDMLFVSETPQEFEVALPCGEARKQQAAMRHRGLLSQVAGRDIKFTSYRDGWRSKRRFRGPHKVTPIARAAEGAA
jgi:uncharacterized protein YdaU (DUF1376 family)